MGIGIRIRLADVEEASSAFDGMRPSEMSRTCDADVRVRAHEINSD